MASEEVTRRGPGQLSHLSVDELLAHIHWSQQSLSLASFVEQYQMPQIVKVEEGYYGAEDESSLSAGQILKVHYTRVSRRVRALDRVGNEVHIPLHTHYPVMLKPKNYKVIYHSVADLAHAHPRPRFVEITQGYYNVDSSDSQELSIEPGEKLEVGGVEVLTIRGQHRKYMTFTSFNGVEVKLPFSCMAGFKPWDDIDEHLLKDVVAAHSMPIIVQFVGDQAGSTGCESSRGNVLNRLGVLKLEKVYSEELIVASCGHNGNHVIFTIPKSLAITVKIAWGTLRPDPLYNEICAAYHDLSDVETKVIESHEADLFSGPGGLKEHEYERVADLKGCAESAPRPLIVQVENGTSESFGVAWHGVLYEDAQAQEGTCRLITLPEEPNDTKHREIETATLSSMGSTETFGSRSSTLDFDPYSSKGEADDELEYDHRHVAASLEGVRIAAPEASGTCNVAIGRVRNEARSEETTVSTVGGNDREGTLTPTLTVTPITPSFGSQTIHEAELVTNPDPMESNSAKATARRAEFKARQPSDSTSDTDDNSNIKQRGVLWNNTSPVDSGNMSSASDGCIYAMRTKALDKSGRYVDAKLRSMSFESPSNHLPFLEGNPNTESDKVRSLSHPVMTDHVQKPQPAKLFTFSQDLGQLSIEEVCQSLRQLNLGHLEDTFRHHQINGGLLVCLDDESLKDLKLSSFERRKLLNFIKGWRPDT